MKRGGMEVRDYENKTSRVEFRCGGLVTCVHRRSERVKFKKISLDKAMVAVARLLSMYWEKGAIRVSSDDIGIQLRIKPHLVERVFHVLNLKGIVSRPVHSAPAHTPRGIDPSMGSICESSVYTILRHPTKEKQ